MTHKQKKASEIFEGENSSLRRTFEKATSPQECCYSKQQIEEEFEKVLPSTFDHICLPLGDGIICSRKDILDFIFSTLDRVVKEVYEKGCQEHKTQEGYCCACDYDIAGLKEEKEWAFNDGIDAAIQGVEKLSEFSLAVEDKEKNFSFKVISVQALLEKLNHLKR